MKVPHGPAAVREELFVDATERFREGANSEDTQVRRPAYRLTLGNSTSDGEGIMK